jgi:hypothetical protein
MTGAAAHGLEQLPIQDAESNEQVQLTPSMESQQRAGMSPMEEIALGKIKNFCAKLLKMLAPPLLKEIESSKELRAEAEPFTPRRVTRSTAVMTTSGKPPRKVSTADTALLTALGIAPNELTVNEAHLEDLQHLFDSPLRDQHLRAIAALYGRTVPANCSEVGQCQRAVSLH